MDTQMMSAIFAETIDKPKNTSAVIPLTCETGNCTFSHAQDEDGATLMSLAFCGQCEDI